MLPRRMRLSRQDLSGFKPAMRVDSPHFSVALGPEGQKPGFAAVISKKVAKLSVTRHLLKRRIMAVFKDFPENARSVVVYAKAGAPSLPFSVLKEELSALLQGKI